MAFTFKKHKETGLRAVAFRPRSEIKLKRKWVGTITEDGVIKFMVKKEPTEKDPASFKWIRLKHVAGSDEAARKFVNEKFNAIMEMYDLHQNE